MIHFPGSSQIGAGKEPVQSEPSRTMKPVEGYAHYEAVEVSSDYADVEQRWVLFRNKQSQQSEQKTLTRRMQKKSLEECKKLQKLGKKRSSVKGTPWRPSGNGRKNLNFARPSPRFITKACYKGKGRPADEAEPGHLQYNMFSPLPYFIGKISFPGVYSTISLGCRGVDAKFANGFRPVRYI